MILRGRSRARRQHMPEHGNLLGVVFPIVREDIFKRFKQPPINYSKVSLYGTLQENISHTGLPLYYTRYMVPEVIFFTAGDKLKKYIHFKMAYGFKFIL